MIDFGSHRHLAVITRKIIWGLIIFLSTLMTIACSLNIKTSPPIPEIIVTRELIASPGTIIYEDGCLFLQKMSERYTLVWWPRLRPIVHKERGVVEIIEPGKDPITVILNEQSVVVGGGFTEHPQGPEFDVVDGTADVGSCPPPYWLVGGVRPE